MRLIFDYLVGKPGRLTSIGKVTGHIGWFFSLAALFGWFPGAVEDAVAHQGHKSLGELYPQLPLWWVPESLPASVLVVAALIAGVWIVTFGHRIDRLYESS